MATLSNRASFWTAASIVAVALLVSASPTMVYPEYQSEWHLTSITTTAVFAVYPLVLVIMLVVFGGVSDYIGRKRTLLIGLITAAVGILLMAIAWNIGLVFAGRILQGVGIGLATSPASAALVDFNTKPDKSFSGAVNSAAAALGVVASMVLGGALIQYAPWPTHLVFWVLLLLTVIVLACTVFLPAGDTRAQASGRWRPRRISVPAPLRGFVTAGVIAMLASGVLGAILMALGAQIAKELLHTNNLLVSGSVLAITFVVGGIISIAGDRIHPRVAIIIGGVISAAFFVVIVISGASSSLPVFIAACLIGGFGYGLLYLGGIGMINLHAPVRFRASTLSIIYLVAYLGQAVIALLIGTLATVESLQSALETVTPFLVALALVASAVTVFFGRKPRGDAAEALLTHPSERTRGPMAPGHGELAKTPVAE